MKIENIIRERIKDNKNLFTKEEYENIDKNISTYMKVYLLSMLDEENKKTL